MRAEVGVLALGWADLVMEGSFFVMQIYLTDVWKLSFTSAATFLNIWGGIHRILPLLFLYLADTILGNFKTLGLSAIFSTTGLVLITVTTGGGYICHNRGEKEECVGHTEKAFFYVGMGLLALGRAARFASARPFIEELRSTDQDVKKWLFRVSIAKLLFVVPIGAAVVFAYVKKWYLLWGVAAIFMAIATLLFFYYNIRSYYISRPREDGSPVSGLVRVFVVSAFNISKPTPNILDRQHFHVASEDDEFKKLSPTRLLGFLHKAAIKLDDGKKKNKWLEPCSVSQVESAKIVIRMVLVHNTYLMCGVVSSIANTYLVEQATQMTNRLGKWEDAPIQLMLAATIAPIFVTPIIKYFYSRAGAAAYATLFSTGAPAYATLFSIVCCAVSAAIERRRFHMVRRLDLVDGAKTPMTAYWLVFPFLFLSYVDAFFHHGLSRFHKEEGPESLQMYNDCMVEAVSGLGYMCGTLSVYVVGKVSRLGSGKGWFQDTLNRSRLDRYYWLLTAVTTLNLLICILVTCAYSSKKTLLAQMNEDADDEQ